MIRTDGKQKSLGCYHDEKEAARMYDEQAALLGKPVNFPLHEGMEQAVKSLPKGSGTKAKARPTSFKGDHDDDSDEESMMEEWDSDAALDDEADDVTITAHNE